MTKLCRGLLAFLALALAFVAVEPPRIEAAPCTMGCHRTGASGSCCCPPQRSTPVTPCCSSAQPVRPDALLAASRAPGQCELVADGWLLEPVAASLRSLCEPAPASGAGPAPPPRSITALRI